MRSKLLEYKHVDVHSLEQAVAINALVWAIWMRMCREIWATFPVKSCALIAGISKRALLREAFKNALAWAVYVLLAVMPESKDFVPNPDLKSVLCSISISAAQFWGVSVV